MSKRQETIVFNLQANVEQIKQSANEINSVFSKLNLPQSVQASFSKTFNKLTEDIRTFEAQAGKGFKNLADTKKAEKNIETIVTDFEKLRVQVKDVKGFSADKLLPKEVLDRVKQYKELLDKANKLTLKDNSSGINRAAEAVKKAQQKFDDNEQSIKKNNAAIKDNEDRYKELSQYISDAEKSLKALVARREELKNKKNKTNDEASEYAILDTRIKAVKSSLTSYNKELISNEANGKKLEETQSQLSLSAVTLQENLNKANQELTNIKNSSAVTDSEIKNLQQSLANVDPGTLPDTLQGLITRIRELSADASNIDAIKTTLGELESKLQSGADDAQQFGQTFHSSISQSVEDMTRANSEMDQLKTRLTYFFSAMNGVQLFKRAIRSAYESVKELDAAITEMAVVTDYSINDIWGNIPEYTRTATELGATTKDVINSMVLYTQQGLKMSQATELSTQTMKMARIAGLEGAEATDLMTAALRGFNMELSETSAQRVNDVYSNLAANAAANTHEIADAMTRTASIANAAGMEFETTAAFLTQMIETTRESAENLGTAMKTIVARFTEMKKAPTDVINVDGEEISVNKVEAALKSVGVELRNTTGEFRELDDVFLELASKWDSLDVMSQRYVATMAAGSRQQSRFIAMMSNYQRTMELMGYATNSAGASQKQFEKTMDSLESKLNRLHDAWEQYVTGIANQSIIKGVVDLLTGLLETVNKITDALDPFHTGWAKILTAFLGFKAAKGVVNNVLRGIGTQLGTRKSNQVAAPSDGSTKTGLDEKQGTVDGTKYGKGFWGAFQKMRAQRQAQSTPKDMPLDERTKFTKDYMKSQGISTKKFTLTGKDTKAAKILKEQSKEYSKQSTALKNLNSEYTKYSGTLQSTNKSNAAFRDSTKATRANLIAMETEYQKMEGASEKDVAASKARVAALQSEENTIGRNTGAKKLNASAEEMSTFAKETNIGATEAEASAIKANTAATVLEGKAIDVENIKLQAGNMTRTQAIIGLFSFNKNKRLAAMLSLGLASAEEIEAIATEGAAGAQTAFNAALYQCPLVWIIALVVAAIAVIILLINAIKNYESEEDKRQARLKTLNDLVEESKNKANEAKEAFDNFLENRGTYNQLKDEIQALVVGSDEFIAKLNEINSLVEDVLADAPELGQYVTYDKNGVATLSSEGWEKYSTYLKQVEQKAKISASAYEMALASDEITASYKNFSNKDKNIDVWYVNDDGEIIQGGAYGNPWTGEGKAKLRSKDASVDYLKTVDEWLKKSEEDPRYRIYRDIDEEDTPRGYKHIKDADGNTMAIPQEMYDALAWVKDTTVNAQTSTTGGKSTSVATGIIATGKPGEGYELTGGTIIRAINTREDDAETQKNAKASASNAYKSASAAYLMDKKGLDENIAGVYSEIISKRVSDDMEEIDKEIKNTEAELPDDFDKLKTQYENLFKIDYKPEDFGLEEDSDEDDKVKALKVAIAANKVISERLESDWEAVQQAVKKYDKFEDALYTVSGDVTKYADKELISALLGTASAADYFGEQLNGCAEILGKTGEELQKDWENAQASARQAVSSGANLFGITSISKEQAEAGVKQGYITAGKSNLIGSKEYTQAVEKAYNEANQGIADFTNKIGPEMAVKFGNLAGEWLRQGFKADSIFKDFKTSDILKDIDSASAFYDEIKDIDFSTPIQAASKIKALAKDTNEEYAKAAKLLETQASTLINSQKQVAQLYNEIDSDTWGDLLKDSKVTREEVEELKDTLPDVTTFLDNTGISSETLAKYLGYVSSGMLDIVNTSSSFVEALDLINSATNNVNDSLDFVKNFETSTSQTEIGDKFSDWREEITQSLERGQYGDQALIDYSKMILGNDNWNKYYAEFEGNLQKIEELVQEKINLWGENFYGLWQSFAGQNSLASLEANGAISLDMSQISSLDDIKKALMETFDISEEVAEAAIADAQTYSNDFSEAIKQFSLGESLSTLINGAFSIDGKRIINENELQVLAEEAGQEASALKTAIEDTAKKQNFTIEFSAEPVLAADGTISENIANQFAQQITDSLSKEGNAVNLDEIYTSMINAGLSEEQIKQAFSQIMKTAQQTINKNPANFVPGDTADKIYYYVEKGILKTTTSEETAKAFGIYATSLEEATSIGMLSGLTDPKVRLQEELTAIEEEKNMAKATAIGVALGFEIAKDDPKLDELAKQVEAKIGTAINNAYSGKIKSINDEMSKLNETEVDTNSLTNSLNAYFNNLPTTVTFYANTQAQDAGKSGGSWPDDSDSDSDNDWTNDYDKYYNTLKKIEGLERKRTELEKQQSRLTKQRYLDEEKIKANKKAQVDILKQQARINSDLADTAAAYLRGDSNGDVWFDEATGTIQTNPNAANYNEEQMEAFNDQKSLMEDHYETWKEAKDNLEDIYDAIDELTEVAEFSLEDLTDSVDRAIEVLDNTLTNLDREISRLDRYNSGATSSDYKKRYEQSAQTYADKYNQLTTKKAINEQKLNGQMHSEYGKYINVDWSTKEVTKSALYYAITDPEVKDSVDDFVSNTQEIASDIIDMDNQQEEIKDSLYELQQTLADKSLEFQEKVYDAVVKAREDEITTLNNIDNSIKNAASDLISSVQKNLQKIRQDRQNQDKEEELQNMEARLAYYQVDTSNANQKNILDLQKQLEDKQRSYTDTLIDQKISELQQQNDDAAAQRKRQIEIMETQLELDKENGVIWKAVDNAIRVGFNSSGRIQKGSDLYNMLSSLDEVTKKNSVQFERWFGELNNLAAAYNANLTANLDTSGQMSNTVANANDVYGENSEYIKSLKSRLEAMNRDGNFNNLMWYDQEGQKMVYKYSHYYASSQTEADDYNKKVAEYQALARELANARVFYKTNKNASFVSAFNRLYGYDSGGLADYTGFAWLDGTPTSPEMVLSPKDTENFIQLRDILSNVLSGDTGKNSGTNGDYYFEIAINVDKVTSDYDVDQIADRIKQQITNDARYRNVNTINMIR